MFKRLLELVGTEPANETEEPSAPDKPLVASVSELVVCNSLTNGSKYVRKFNMLPALASKVATTINTIVALLNMNNW